MADTIRRTDYYYTHVKDVPGEAYRILSHLKEKGVSLIAFSASRSARRSSVSSSVAPTAPAPSPTRCSASPTRR
jgi:hypothetical protein